MLRSLVLGGVALALLSVPANAQVRVQLEPFVTGVNAPLAMEQADDGRFFIIEQFGRVRIADGEGNLEADPFLDIRDKIVTLWADFDERGLLGFALHPDFANNGKFYVAYSANTNFQGALEKLFWWDHTNVVAEYTVSADNPNKADRTSERIISSIDWPQFNHNGHWIGFGPDGMLYVSTGDGGYANDWGIGHNVTEGNGQDLTTPLGKILRLDVDAGGPAADNPFAGQEGARPEIWAYGLRNPWRCSFDMGGDGSLICGDVQQNSYEEVSVINAGDNLGWRRMEASHCFDYVNPNDHPESCDQTDLVPPVLEYLNCTAQPVGCEGISVTGGYVYRGEHQPWDGTYFFGDWSQSFGAMDGQLFAATPTESGTWTRQEVEVVNADEIGMDGRLPYILAFAQDDAGEVYALTTVTTGPVGSLDTIYRIAPAE